MKDKTAFDWTTGSSSTSAARDKEADKVAAAWKAKPTSETRTPFEAVGSPDPFSSAIDDDPRDQAGAFVAARVTEPSPEAKDDVFAAAQGKPAVFAEHSTSQAFAVSGGLKSTERSADHPFVHRESLSAPPLRLESPPAPPKENPFATRPEAAVKEREAARWSEPEIKENPFATRPEPEAKDNPFAKRPELEAKENPFAKRPELEVKENPFATRPEPEPPAKKHPFGGRK